jgi:ribosomal protein S12 methylthiotransferase accessory factor
MLEVLVSRRVGLIRRIHVRRNASLAFGLTIASAEPANYGLLPLGHAVPSSGGVGCDDLEAGVPAMVEAIERYCALFGGLEAEHIGPARSDAYLYGAGLGVYADWQYDTPGFFLKRHNASANVRWCRGRSLLTGRTRFIPSAWIRVPFNSPMDSERLYCSNSSGCAAAFTRRDAIIGALLELCERDAFMVMWHHRLAMPQIEVDLTRLVGPDLGCNVLETTDSVRFLALTNDIGVPVAACVIEREWHRKKIVSIGLSARSDLFSACRKAFYEAASESYRAITDRQYAHWSPDIDFSNVTDFPVRPLVYRDEVRYQKLAFMWSSKSILAVDDAPCLPMKPTALLRALLQALRHHVSDVVAVPLTTTEARVVGVHAVKVTAPGLATLYADHRLPQLGTQRIWRAAEALGGDVDPSHTRIPNDLPHPFA